MRDFATTAWSWFRSMEGPRETYLGGTCSCARLIMCLIMCALADPQVSILDRTILEKTTRISMTWVVEGKWSKIGSM